MPGRLADLVTLPGVGRKTANVVLGNAFGVPGITVDTHFGRLVRRFGWTAETDPVKVEHAIGALFPKRDWTMLSHVLIFHGRRTCHARKPACGACPVAQWCPSYGEGETDPVKARKLLAYELAPGALVLPDPPPGPLPDDPPRRRHPEPSAGDAPSRAAYDDAHDDGPRAARRPGAVGVTAPTPGWLTALAARTDVAEHEWFATYAPPEGEGRRSAVLMLFGPDPRGGEDVVLTERAHTLRSHPGQVSFPGGRLDPDDDGSVAAALREAEEEVGPRPRRRRGARDLPRRLPRPEPARRDPGARVVADPGAGRGRRPGRGRAGAAGAGGRPRSTPANRFTAVFGPYRGPAFEVDDLFVWGFTAMLLSSLFDLAGLAAALGRRPRAAAARPGHVAVDAGDARSERVGRRSTWSCVPAPGRLRLERLAPGFRVGRARAGGAAGRGVPRRALRARRCSRTTLGIYQATPVGVLALLAAVIGAALLGQGLMLLLARRFRDVVTAPAARAVDSALGLVAVLVTALLVVWVVAGAVSAGGPAGRARPGLPLGGRVRRSTSSCRRRPTASSTT